MLSFNEGQPSLPSGAPAHSTVYGEEAGGGKNDHPSLPSYRNLLAVDVQECLSEVPKSYAL